MKIYLTKSEYNNKTITSGSITGGGNFASILMNPQMSEFSQNEKFLVSGVSRFWLPYLSSP